MEPEPAFICKCKLWRKELIPNAGEEYVATFRSAPDPTRQLAYAAFRSLSRADFIGINGLTEAILGDDRYVVTYEGIRPARPANS